MNKEIDIEEMCKQFGIDDPEMISEDDVLEYIIEQGRCEYRAEWFTYTNGWD